MESDWISGLIWAASIAAAASGVAKTVQKAVQGKWPHDDIGGHLKDVFVDSVPVVGALGEAVTEDRPWGDAAMQAGTELLTLAVPAFGSAVGGVGDTAAKMAAQSMVEAAQGGTSGAIPAAAAAAAPAAALQGAGAPGAQSAADVIDDLGAISADTAQAAKLSTMPSGVREAFQAATAPSSAATPATLPAGQPSLLEQMFSPAQAEQFPANVIGQLPTDVGRNTGAGAVRGMVTELGRPSDQRDMGTAALMGAIGGGAGVVVDTGQNFIPRIKPLTEGLVPSSRVAQPPLQTGPDFDPLGAFASTQPPSAALDPFGLGNEVAPSVWNSLQDDNSWRDAANKTIRTGANIVGSNILKPGLASLEESLRQPYQPPVPGVDPYAFYRRMPGFGRRRLV